MRSKLASGAVGLGVFLIVAAVLVRAYAYPSLAKVPADYEGITYLEATGAQVFNSDPEILATEVTDLSIASRTVADTGADAPDGTPVWVNSATVTRADGTVFQQSRERVAFDAGTGAAVDCDSCEPWVEVADGEQRTTDFEGQVYKFPFGTEKKTYPVWDGTTGRAVDATFEGEEQIDGLTVYKFVQRIDPEVVELRDVPGSVFGSTEPTVEAEMWYEMTRTFYIEPETGSPVNRVEDRVQELRYDGVSVSAFTGTVQYTDDQVADLVADAKSNARMLAGMQLLFPVLIGLLGAILLAAGLFLGRSSGRERQQPRNEKELAGV
ncbi:DUF3068 domain-containing protein [Nocardioides caeni]|uniref:DUF3068 domain-containing protein n=1 Tax=Nocardioides caeni TaxID=574700 RepID=A0A4S8NU39_9ACTN|nr:DUF3068 domain-containing protein [Nocardioides caeni]THV18599.1 DUF3068 domain-containing protein [Nocardioides caeni]